MHDAGDSGRVNNAGASRQVGLLRLRRGEKLSRGTTLCRHMCGVIVTNNNTLKVSYDVFVAIGDLIIISLPEALSSSYVSVFVESQFNYSCTKYLRS